ncbi:MAG: WYL domain-containing protein, partial [Burkholderiaceae bacterium]|nr:WYL domain-containing protein [Burkholderiaceae bacterium]
RERLFWIEVKAFFCGDLTRADIERRFGVKPAASARDFSTYRRLAPHNLFYDAGQRKYATTDRFLPLFEHSAERVLTWFRAGFGDSIDQKLKRTVPCESASNLVKPDIDTLAILTRAIAGRRQVKVNYLSLTSGPSAKTLCPLALADTGLRWHLRAYDRERGRFADFALTRIVKAKAIDQPIPVEEQIESDVQWARIVHIELVPHPGIAYPKVIEADFMMNSGVLALNMRAPLVGYALRRWSVDCSPAHQLDPKQHHLWLSNQETLYGVESAALAPGYEIKGGSVE